MANTDLITQTGQKISAQDPNYEQYLKSGATPQTDLGTITSLMLSPESPLNFKPAPSSPVFPVQTLDSQLQMTQPEQQAQSLSEQMAELNAQLLGQTTFKAEAEKAAGLPEAERSLKDLSARLKGLQAEALSIPLQLQQQATGKGVTEGGLRPLQTAKLRENAIQALSTASLFEAAKGNYETAVSMADRAIKERFDPIKEQIAVAKENLQLILDSPAYSLADKNRAIRQQEIQDAKARQIAKMEQDQKDIMGFATEAAKFGADATTLNAIQTAKSPREALNLAGRYLGADFAAKMEKDAFDKQMQELSFDLSVKKFNEDKRQFNAQYALDQQRLALEKLRISLSDAKDSNTATEKAEKEKKIAESMATTLDDKIKLLDTISTSSALDSAVGPSAGLGRFGRFFTQTDLKDSFGAKSNFLGDVENLASAEVVQTLVDMKAQGGTFGALNEEELNILKSASTKINSWAVKNDKGKIVGYDVDEKSFKKELTKLKSSAQKLRMQLVGDTGVGGNYNTKELLSNPVPQEKTLNQTTPEYSPSVWGKVQ